MESFNDILSSERLTLIDFYATWCGPCKMMHPVLERLKSELGDTLLIIKIDIDRNEALAAQYRIQSVPTLMLAKGGEIVWRQSGAMGLDGLKKIVAMYSD